MESGEGAHLVQRLVVKLPDGQHFAFGLVFIPLKLVMKAVRNSNATNQMRKVLRSEGCRVWNWRVIQPITQHTTSS